VDKTDLRTQWRLSVDGCPSAGFRWENGRIEQREGVRFTGDVADPTQRLTIVELGALLAAE
jgi:hypothetical protein